MAIKELTPVKCDVNKVTNVTLEAATSTDEGFTFVIPRASDEYVVVLIANTTATTKNITVKAPTSGSYAASSTDETFQLGANETGVFRFESARWANNDGTVSIIPESTDILVAVTY